MDEPAPATPRENEAAPAPAKASWGVRISLVLVVAAIVLGIVGLRMRNAASGGGGPGGRGGPGGDQGPTPVRTIHAELRDVPIHLEGLGTVTPLETATVRARVSGQLERVRFTEGQDVHAGDVLAELDARPFRVALAQAQAVLARDQASLAAARTTLDRDRQLHAHELLSTQDLEAQEASVAALEATERADRAAVDSARLSVEYARIVAPIDGRTGLRQVDPGNLVSSSDANGIVVITRVDPIAVVFTLPQDELGGVLARMHEGELPVDVLSRDGVRTLASGHLAVIDNRIDTATGTVRMKAEVPNGDLCRSGPRSGPDPIVSARLAGHSCRDQTLWPNQLVEVRMLLETRHDALVVPDATVQQGPDGAFVYVVVDHHAQIRAVHVERIVEDVAILIDGVTLADEIVSEGQSRLRPDAEVRLETDPPPASGPPGGGGSGGERRGAP